MKDCAERKSLVILFSAVCRDGGGGRREQKNRGFVREAGIRSGPNVSIVNTHEHIATSFTSGLEIDFLIPGAIGLITQSGGKQRPHPDL
jgi:hypothetical protein